MKPINNNSLRWLGIDLDNTIAHTEPPHYELQDPMPGARDALNELTKRGWKIIIHTSRPWDQYETIESWLDDQGIPFRRIVCGKLLAKYFVDDRNLEFSGNWDEVIKKIL